MGLTHLFVRALRRRMLVLGGILTTGFALLAASASASPATYYASPSSSDTSGSCSVSAPCRLDHAVALAGPGDVVVVLPGTYSINYPVSTSLPITIEGQPGEPRPSLVGDPSLSSDTLEISGGAVVRHLEVETQNNLGAQTAALSIDGGIAEDLVLVAGSADSGGEALSAKDASSGTIVRTVLAVSRADNGEAASFKDSKTSPGTANVYNLTAVASGLSSEALSGNVATGTVWIKDSIAHGQGSDISTKPGTQALNLTYSDFRAADSSGYTDQGGNVLAAPVFLNASAGDYHEAETSPTVDAGAGDPALTQTDLDGDPRVLGAASDMGAYEYDSADVAQSGAPAPQDPNAQGQDDSTALPPSGAPVAGVSIKLRHVSGTVRVELPGRHRFLRLSAESSVPVGSVVDVTQGGVVLTSGASRSAPSKSGLFHGGRFIVTQATGAHPTTNLRLVGGSFAACSAAGAAPDQAFAGIARRRPRPHRVVRQLWGSDSGGSFVTIGNTASAAVRGTVWLTQDRCDGTLVRVLRGAVLVHDDARGRDLLIHRGQAYLARARG